MGFHTYQWLLKNSKRLSTCHSFPKNPHFLSPRPRTEKKQPSPLEYFLIIFIVFVFMILQIWYFCNSTVQHNVIMDCWSGRPEGRLGLQHTLSFNSHFVSAGFSQAARQDIFHHWRKTTAAGVSLDEAGGSECFWPQNGEQWHARLTDTLLFFLK